MSAAFGWDLEKYSYHGGYPGAATLVGDHGRWINYILDSLVETTMLLVRNTALMSAFLGLSQPEARRAPEILGRLVESTALTLG